MMIPPLSYENPMAICQCVNSHGDSDKTKAGISESVYQLLTSHLETFTQFMERLRRALTAYFSTRSNAAVLLILQVCTGLGRFLNRIKHLLLSLSYIYWLCIRTATALLPVNIRHKYLLHH
ncbi:uncharacterized protein NEPG_00144 [Nematocida parisii ERTm1]|uniref:uncharacterized protein n=1 Tax=Nematocida parisii (strain ERTm1 / ATCC PRA-289) TaxID=881290 RepID=UPI000264B926|nr:uncharacterized protein NEPG_00144 [Nematocida parisii ERTm1]EIJ94622.1 hypothetical protein NEPG_00144 [Nematocida parisii ERTm1]|eukprot:XP_013057978.1 hypothetical protein NEPG_00144 [Nematocida parisii ERTm1]